MHVCLVDRVVDILCLYRSGPAPHTHSAGATLPGSGVGEEPDVMGQWCTHTPTLHPHLWTCGGQ